MEVAVRDQADMAENLRYATQVEGILKGLTAP